MTARSCGPRSRLRSFPGSRSTSQEYSRHDSRQPYPLHLTPQDRGIEAGDGGDLDRPPWRAEEEKRERPPVATGDEGKQGGTGEGKDDRMREAAMTVRRAVRNTVPEAERVDVRKNRSDDGGNGHACGCVARAQERDSGVGENRRHVESIVMPDSREWAP